MLNILLLLGGFVALILGADKLVDAASSLAKKLGVPNIVIGLTIVAFGTSAPELVVNVFAAANNNTDMVLGNVIGSNLFNVLAILGICATIYPLTVKRNTTWLEIPLSLLAALVVLLIASDIPLDGAASNIISRSEGLVLLLFFLGAYCIPVGRLAKSTILFWGLYTIGLLAVTTLTANGFLIMGYNRNAGYMLLFLPSLSALLIYYMRGRGIFGVLLICAAHTVIALIALQNSIGSYVLVALACMCLLLYAIAQGWFDCRKTVAILLVVLPVVLLFASMIAVQPSRFAQLLALFLPEFAPDPLGAGFLGATVREILGAARMIGPMDAAAVRSTAVDYISRSTAFENDCMLTLLAARLGKIVFAAAVLLLATFVFLSLRACRKQRSMLGKLISLSILLTFAVQAAGYIAGNLGITMLLRYPMPFVAFGNQAMLCNLILCGLLFSTFRTGNLLDDGRLQKRTRWKLKLVREAE